jgi:peptide/nickel transport system ATP-binding protein
VTGSVAGSQGPSSGPADAEELLRFENVSVSYRTEAGPLPAVRSVDLAVRAGEVVGLAGESGCGKSTLAATVLRLQPEDAVVTGSVRVLGEDVQTLQWGRLRALRWAGASIVFQGALHSLNPVHRVADQVAEPIRVHRPELGKAEVAEQVDDLLARVGLPPGRGRAYPHQLSGGQKQRVMIAMALACRPRLIVADEPTTALDVMVQAQVLELLVGSVRDLGVGMLLISHDLSVLADVCDRVAVMYAGRVVELGRAAEVFAQPLHPYAAALSAAFPRVGDPAARYAPGGLPGDPPDPRDLPRGCTFHPRCARAAEPCTAAEPPLLAFGDRRAACIRVGEPDPPPDPVGGGRLEVGTP